MISAPPRKIRVLIVDDSIVACKVLTEVISADPWVDVAGTALSGPLALSKLGQCMPDVILLDMEMGGMDGLQTLAEIRKIKPKLPVIMCSRLTEAGSQVTMQALLKGASDYVTKPTAEARKGAGLEAFRRDLLDKIKNLGNPGRETAPAPRPARDAKGKSPEEPPSPIDAEILIVGVSTGGPNALAEFLPELPTRFPVPIVIVQHMPPLFTKSLAQTLSRKCALNVVEGAAGSPLEAGAIHIAPGGFHATLARRDRSLTLALNSEPPVNSCRPSVDVLFQSAAQVCGSKVLAVVLTGMGQDGLAGSQAVRKAGGKVFAQDEASSVVWGMPGSVVRAGLANRVLPLQSMAGAIMAGFARKRPHADQ